MGSGWRYVHKQGPRIGGRAPDVIGYLPRDNVGIEVLGVVVVGDGLTVLVDPVIVELLFVQLAVPLVPTRREVCWIPIRIPIEVLAEESGSVAPFL